MEIEDKFCVLFQILDMLLLTWILTPKLRGSCGFVLLLFVTLAGDPTLALHFVHPGRDGLMSDPARKTGSSVV